VRGNLRKTSLNIMNVLINACVVASLSKTPHLPVLGRLRKAARNAAGPDRGGRGPFGPGGGAPANERLNLVERFDRDGYEWF